MSTFTVYQRVPNDLFEDSSPHPCAPLPLFTSLLISLCLCLFIIIYSPINFPRCFPIYFPSLFISLFISLLISLCISVCSPESHGPWPHAPRGWEWHPLHHRWFASCPQGPAGCWSQRSWTPCLARPSRRRRTWCVAEDRGGAPKGTLENVQVSSPKKMRLTWGLIPYTTEFWTGIHVFYPAPIISILKVLFFLSVSLHLSSSPAGKPRHKG